MKRIFISAAVLIAVVTLSAQELKTYSGSFKGGQATYTYYEADNGRIFEGEFHWKEDSVQRGYIKTKASIKGIGEIVGSFKNNKRNGLWTFTATNEYRLGKENVKKVNVLKVNYVDGIREGAFDFVQQFNDMTDEIEIHLLAAMKNGRVDGPVKIEMPNSVITGQYTHNTRTGVWERRFSNGSYYHIVCNGSKLFKGYDVDLEEKREGNIFYDIEDGSKKAATEYDAFGRGELDKSIFEAAMIDLETGRINLGLENPKEEPKPIPSGNTTMSQSNMQGKSEPALSREEAILRYKQNNAKSETEKLRENLERLGFRKKKK